MRAHAVVVVAGLTGSMAARAEVDPRCQGLPQPADYDEQVQQDFQQNYFALVSSWSPSHAPVPHAGGHGAVFVGVSIVPPLSCARRFVLDWTKTEDTNITPMIPRLGLSYAAPVIADRLTIYGSFAFLPPLRIAGTRSLILSGELGFGVEVLPLFDVGARFHTTLQRTYGDIATAFDPETEPVVEDVFVGSTWGIDVLLGVPIEVKSQQITPFVAVGYLDASTFFFVGDSDFASENKHPYSGAALSAGLDMLLAKRFRFGAELYAAPGGYSLPDKTVTSVDRGSRYGNLVTGRLRIGVEL